MSNYCKLKTGNDFNMDKISTGDSTVEARISFQPNFIVLSKICLRDLVKYKQSSGIAMLIALTQINLLQL